jgi:hypothetical protein
VPPFGPTPTPDPTTLTNTNHYLPIPRGRSHPHCLKQDARNIQRHNRPPLPTPLASHNRLRPEMSPPTPPAPHETPPTTLHLPLGISLIATDSFYTENPTRASKSHFGDNHKLYNIVPENGSACGIPSTYQRIAYEMSRLLPRAPTKATESPLPVF